MVHKIGYFFILLLLIFGTLYAQNSFQVINPDTSAVTDSSGQVKNDTTSAETIQIPIDTKTAVAVLELDPNGVSDSEARALSDRLRIEIFNAGVFEVMEREKMNRILDEMQFHLNDCTSDECAIEIGRLIGVKNIIAGSISKVGEFFTVSARLIDVETSKIEATAIEDVEGSLGIVLTKAMPSIALKISGQAGLDISTEVVKSFINISVEPIYSSIYIDGKYQGESPLKIELEPASEYILKVEKDGCESLEKRFTLTKGQQLDMNIVLSKVVEPQVSVHENKKAKRSILKGFRLKYISTGRTTEINEIITDINKVHGDGNKLFKDKPLTGTTFNSIKSFNGIEVYNSSSVEDNIGFEFGLGLYRADLDDWFSKISNGNNSGYNLVTWSPQIMLNLRIAPIRYPLFYPYFDVGFGYNLLIMNLYNDEESLGGPMYQSWGFIYGIGFEIKPIRYFGVSLEWSRKNSDMQIMDVDEISDRFKDFSTSDDLKLDEINLTGNRIGVSLNFYY